MKLLYDCDAGADDALALRMLCKSGIELMGISTCFGGFPPEQAAIHAEHILHEYGINVPVCAGAKRSLNAQRGSIHSALSAPWRGKTAEAGRFLCELLEASRDEVAILATAPLTNIAAMLRTTSRKPAHIYIMGGGIHGGNRTPDAEFNFFCDPEAADEVLRSGCPVTLLPLEAAKSCALGEADMARLSPAAGDELRTVLEFSKRAHQSNISIPYDAVAAAGLITPAVFTETRTCSCRVDSCGKLLISPVSGPVTLVEKVDPTAFQKLFFAI